MTCEACASLGIDHNKQKELILSSPYQTGVWICGFDWFLRGRFHKDIDRWFREGMNQGFKRFLLMWPRGHLKTTYIVAYIVNTILNDPETRILLRMASADLAENTCRLVTDILMSSEGMKHFFPEKMFTEKDKGVISRNNELCVPRKGKYRESTLVARGINSKVIGGHYRVQIADDLVDDTSIDSDQIQQTAVDRIKRSDPLFVEPAKDIEIIVGTRWPGQFYRWLLEDSGITEEYWTVLLGCYVDDRYDKFMNMIGEEKDKEDGTPVWPEHFSMESLAGIQRKLQENFVHQYLNLEINDEDRRFRREDFRHYKLTGDGCVVTFPGGKTYTVPLSDLYISMTIDPATGEHSRTDQSAITVCGIDRKTGIIFVLDVWQDRVLPDRLINQILNMAEKWKPHVVSPEAVSFQHTLKHFLKKEMLRRGMAFRIKPVAPGRTGKGRRILDSLQPFVANGQMHVLKQHDHTLVAEMVALQVVGSKVVGRSPNLADSLSYHAQYWRSVEMEMAEEDEDEIKNWIPDSGPAYGLACAT
jgi:predicted phage terminase large subunit-like protein